MARNRSAEFLEHQLVATDKLRSYQSVVLRSPREKVIFGLPNLQAQIRRNQQEALEVSGRGRESVYALMYEKRLPGTVVTRHELRLVSQRLMAVYAEAAKQSLRVMTQYLQGYNLCICEAMLTPVGSVAWGAVQDGSDLDILVQFRGKDRHEQLTAANYVFDRIDLETQEELGDFLFRRHQILARSLSLPDHRGDIFLAASRADGTGITHLRCLGLRSTRLNIIRDNM